MPVLVVDQLTRHFGAVEALKGIRFTIEHGAVMALVSDNGAGKSTLVKTLLKTEPIPQDMVAYLTGAKNEYGND